MKTENGDSNANGLAGGVQAATLAPTGGIAQHYRRLKPSEVVVRGDFVANSQLELEPWDGPGGFRAGAFVKPIYRRKSRRALATNK